jgi:A/G-specific adenine glycosylase
VENLSSLHSPLSSKILSTKVLKRNVKHVLTHRILMADFYLLETDTPPQLPADYIWIPEEERDNYAVPRLVELLFESLP